MRIFTIPAGIFAGEYNIYESREEFEKLMPGVSYRRWGKGEATDIKEKDWIEAYDGYILQVIRIKNVSKGKIVVRFPNVSMIIYPRLGKTAYWQRFYGFSTAKDPYSLGGQMAHATRGYKNTERELTFARLIVNGVEAEKAYIQAGFNKVVKSRARFRATELLLKEIVMNEIQTLNKGYLEVLKEDPAFSDEAMSQYVKDFMRHVRKGSQTHLNSIFPLLTLLGKLPKELQKTSGKTKIANVSEAEFNVMPPENGE